MTAPFHNHPSGVNGTRSSTPGSTAPTVPSTGTKSTLVPTNVVTTKDGSVVRARIDPSLAVEDVIRQLCVNLKIKDPPSMFALRDEADEIVTTENLKKKIKARANLKLVNSSALEAADIIEKLSIREEKALKLALFSLQKFIKEESFGHEFLKRGGLALLIDVIHTSHGNTLAYALVAMQNLMDLQYGWSDLDEMFIFKVVQILSSPQSLINVCRPATAILKKLVEADPHAIPGSVAACSSKNPPSPDPGSVFVYGFSVVWEQMRKERRLLETVVNRLGSADTALTLYSMMLINSLLTHVDESRWEEFVDELERLNVRKAVIRLMSSHTIEDLSSCILDFQANIVRATYRRKTTPVDPVMEPSHSAALAFIWTASRLSEEEREDGLYKWRKLGFNTEDLSNEFNDVGILGLECMRHFVAKDSEHFATVVMEQSSRPLERRCPIARSSNEVVELLSEHWAIFAPGYSTSTTFQPFFLDFHKVHSLALQFFLRMWNESGSSVEDFTRIVALTRSQVKVALLGENVRPWHEVEQDFLESDYQAVRERQMKELEEEDDLLSKVPVRNLRAKLYKESYEFVLRQRIHCLMQGAWLTNAIPLTSPGPRDTVRRPARPWRFLRLDSSLKYMHYVDSASKFPVRSGLEDLPERIEIAQITEVATGTCAPPPHVLRDNNDLPPNSPLMPSPLSFSLLSANDGSLADQIAPDVQRWADWTDGLNMLRKDGGHVASRETAGFVQALTEIGLKIKLLDLAGERVEIPSGLVAGPPPQNTDFFFSDLTYDSQI